MFYYVGVYIIGGNVFTKPDFKSRRVDLKEFLEIKQELIDLFIVSGLYLYFGAYVRDKTSFGDLDIIVHQSFDEFLEVINRNGFEVSRNNNVLSFLYKDFQIDLIQVNVAILDYAIQYYSWNDIHNLTGKLCKKLGFKHGQNGLEYVIRDHTLNSDNRVRDTIFLSGDPYKHLEILQLDVERYKRGFDDIVSMFDYVSSSPYFDSSIYALSALTNKDRVRDRKRINFQKFLEYCETKQFVQELPFPEDRSTTPLKYFPWLQDRIDSVYRTVALNNELKAKFSGSTILALYPDMPGKEVGKVLAGLRSKYPEGYWIIATKGEINATIKHYVKGLKDAESSTTSISFSNSN